MAQESRPSGESNPAPPAPDRPLEKTAIELLTYVGQDSRDRATDRARPVMFAAARFCGDW